jgi:hypothetical protein
MDCSQTFDFTPLVTTIDSQASGAKGKFSQIGTVGIFNAICK